MGTNKIAFEELSDESLAGLKRAVISEEWRRFYQRAEQLLRHVEIREKFNLDELLFSAQQCFKNLP